MGISAYIIFNENQYEPLSVILRDCKSICTENSLYYTIVEEQKNDMNIINYIRFNISDIPFTESLSRQLCVDVYDTKHVCQRISFNWNDDKRIFTKVLSIDDFCSNEDLLFEFLYKFLKKYPKAKLWTEEDWFYNFAELEKNEEKAI